MSDEHRNYLLKIKREKRVIFFFRIFIIIFCMCLWEILAYYSIINTFLFSSPSKIFSTIIGLFKTGVLIKHVFITFMEVLISFILTTFIGIVIASLFWRFPRVSLVFDPYLTIFNSLPKVALGPLIIIWMGAGYYSIIFMAFLISVFTTIISIYNGFCEVDENYITLLKSFGASNSQIYRMVILPSNILTILSTLKINISLSFIGVIMGELLVSKSGLGYLIQYGSQVFNLDLVISSIFILGILSYVMYFVIDKIFILVQKKRS